MKGSDLVSSILGLIQNNKIDDDISLAKKGDNVAFERLVNDHSISLYRVAKGMLKNEADIEDAFQETILNAYKQIHLLKRNDYFKTWLIKIMINECTNLLRNKKRTVYLDELNLVTIDKNNEFHKFELMDLINCLEEDLKIVTLLYYYEDLPQKEIGELLNIPHGTVRSRLSRAKESLRQLLDVE